MLQILFGEKMDSVRAGLAGLSYTPEEIEGDFIPLMVLRNHFDVGHAQSVIPQSKQLQVLYEYLSKSEDTIRYLLQRVFEQVADGRFKLPEQDHLGFDTEKQKFDQLIDIITPRITIGNKTAS